jgi:hypothetical protein
MNLDLLYDLFSGCGTIAIGMKYVNIVICKLEIGRKPVAPDASAVKMVGGC